MSDGGFQVECPRCSAPVFVPQQRAEPLSFADDLRQIARGAGGAAPAFAERLIAAPQQQAEPVAHVSMMELQRLKREGTISTCLFDRERPPHRMGWEGTVPLYTSPRITAEQVDALEAVAHEARLAGVDLHALARALDAAQRIAVAAERERCAGICFEAGATGASFADAEARIRQADYQPGRPRA